MTAKLTGTFLSLGSILKLKDTEDDTLLYVVIARAIMENEDEEIVPRYRVVAHPQGVVPTQEVLTINATQITEVIFEGYSDDSDTQLLKGLLDMVENDVESANKEEVEEDTSEEPELDEAERLKIDPFYKFRS
jgi:hypothetical protein